MVFEVAEEDDPKPYERRRRLQFEAQEVKVLRYIFEIIMLKISLRSIHTVWHNINCPEAAV